MDACCTSWEVYINCLPQLIEPPLKSLGAYGLTCESMTYNLLPSPHLTDTYPMPGSNVLGFR